MSTTQFPLRRPASCPSGLNQYPEDSKEKFELPGSSKKPEEFLSNIAYKSLSEQWQTWGLGRKTFFTLERVVIRGALYTAFLLAADASVKIAVICIVADLALSFYSGTSYQGVFSTDPSPTTFFPKIKHSFSIYSQVSMICHIAQVLFFFFIPYKPNIQTVSLANVEKNFEFTNPKELQSFRILYTLTTSTLVPLVEEYLFRGVLQEKIREVQSLFTKNYDGTVEKMIRVGLQGSFFGWMHWQEEQGIYNWLIAAKCTVDGLVWGCFKEEHHSLIPGLFCHTLNNAVAGAQSLLLPTD